MSPKAPATTIAATQCSSLHISVNKKLSVNVISKSAAAVATREELMMLIVLHQEHSVF